MQCFYFQLESVRSPSTVGTSHKHHARLLQPHDSNVVAAVVCPPVLHALVSPYMCLASLPVNIRIAQASNTQSSPSSSSQLLAASSQHLRPDQFSAQSNQPNTQSQRPQAARANPEVQMNAQGGEILNEEELNRDWLDWVYTFSRAVILLSIVYFYSSFSRFVMVMMAMLVLYLWVDLPVVYCTSFHPPCILCSLTAACSKQLQLMKGNWVWPENCTELTLFLWAGIRPAGSPSTWRMSSSFLETEPIQMRWRESHKTTMRKKW